MGHLSLDCGINHIVTPQELDRTGVVAKINVTCNSFCGLHRLVSVEKLNHTVPFWERSFVL